MRRANKGTGRNRPTPFKKTARKGKTAGSKSSPKKAEGKPKEVKKVKSNRRSDDGKTFGKPAPRPGQKRPSRSTRPHPSGGPRKAKSELVAPPADGPIRLNKYIAASGVSSRREADTLITMGLISVNGKTITELGYKVNKGDVVRYEGKILSAEKPVYILLNKPKGYLTTTKDPQERRTVMAIIGNAVRERIYPVGRLDRNTTGLLLLTNDGDLAEKMMHPSYEVKKIYKVELDRPLSQQDFQKISQGISLEEGKVVPDDLAIISDDGRLVGIELHVGWNRIVRRIFEALDYEVVKLDRTLYAGLNKKDLPRGHWRHLTNEEIIRLKHFKS